MINKIIYDNILLAIIIRAQYSNDGIEFFTNDNDSQQLGYMARPKGYTIQPHRHNLIKREVHLTQEVLYVKKGKVRVDFFDNQQSYLFSDIISEGVEDNAEMELGIFKLKTKIVKDISKSLIKI